jgi:hypothetical protein
MICQHILAPPRRDSQVVTLGEACTTVHLSVIVTRKISNALSHTSAFFYCEHLAPLPDSIQRIAGIRVKLMRRSQQLF